MDGDVQPIKKDTSAHIVCTLQILNLENYRDAVLQGWKKMCLKIFIDSHFGVTHHTTKCCLHLCSSLSDTGQKKE